MTELKVIGMTCGGCVNSVRRAVERVAPSADPDIELSSGRLRLQLPADAPPDMLDRIRAAIDDAGFSTEVLGA